MNEDIINFLNILDFENSVMVYETVVNLLEEKQELIDYLKEQINERKLTGNDEDYIKLDVYEEILSKIEKGVISNGMEELE